MKGLSISDKTVLDVASIMTVTGTLVDMLPATAAVLTIVWTGIRIYETDTVKAIFGKKKGKDDGEGSEEDV